MINTPEKKADWDWLIPTQKNLLRPDEVASYIRRSLNYVYNEIEAGELEAFAPPDRQVERKLITRRSLLLHLARCAKTSPHLLQERAIEFLRSLDPETRKNIISQFISQS